MGEEVEKRREAKPQAPKERVPVGGVRFQIAVFILPSRDAGEEGTALEARIASEGNDVRERTVAEGPTAARSTFIEAKMHISAASKIVNFFLARCRHRCKSCQ